ncbi:MAG: hypothetical protein JO051_13270 [Acidobacteriaceae bacterium]|nr:hypothetical protein [Acidobacteriaceae bacterium]
MSQDEQLLSNGKLLAEYVATRSKLASMRSEANRIALSMKKISNHIMESTPAGYMSVFPDLDRLQSGDAIKKLLSSIAVESQALSGFEQRLRELGVPVDIQANSKIAEPKRDY